MDHQHAAAPVLICGLGRLGQHAAVLLKELGVPVFGLDRDDRDVWDIEGISLSLDRFLKGDCRLASTMLAAGIELCRSVVLATTDERINISAALAARSVHPKIRLVVRSAQVNMNSLLEHALGNFVALDTPDLAAEAFALAAMGGETVGLLSIGGVHLRVVERLVGPSLIGMEGKLSDLDSRTRRVLHLTPTQPRRPIDFYGWDPDHSATPGDLLCYIEFHEPSLQDARARGGSFPHWTANLRSRFTQLWTIVTQTQKVTAISAVAVLCLHLIAMALYKLQYPRISVLDAFNLATVLLLDGYSSIFGQLHLPFPIPVWLLLFSLLVTVTGALVLGMFYASLTAGVLSSQLQFRRRAGPIPESGHIVVAGMGRIGQCVAGLLRDLGNMVVCISSEPLDAGILPGIPVIQGNLREGLIQAGFDSAASVVAVTGDDVMNLELALLSAKTNPACRVVIRTDDAPFSRSVTALAPKTRAMSVYALSAQAFAAAALGDKVLSLLRIGNETVLAVEFTIVKDDTCDGRLLAEVMYGYGVAPILFQQNETAEKEFFPSGDVKLAPGNRLVVLATIAGLQRTSRGAMLPRRSRVRVIRALTKEAVFEGSRTISRVTGCPLSLASALMNALPGELEVDLYPHQAARLVRKLFAAGVSAEYQREA